MERTRGLSSVEAGERLAAEGSNEIAREAPTPPCRLVLAQFNSPVIWLLLAACVISSALGQEVDAIAIATIVVLNGLVGYLQEARATRAVYALRSMTAPRARVVRDGSSGLVNAVEVVRGDVLLLEAGDLIAADGRLLEAHDLSTSEAALTGESAPVRKRREPASPDAPLAERHDHVFMGTSVATGTGMALVEATGMRSELGQIAHLLATAEEGETPLQQRLAHLSRALLSLCLAIVVVVAALSVWRRFARRPRDPGAVSARLAFAGGLWALGRPRADSGDSARAGQARPAVAEGGGGPLGG